MGLSWHKRAHEAVPDGDRPRTPFHPWWTGTEFRAFGSTASIRALTERRRNRTFQPPGCDGLPVLKAPVRRAAIRPISGVRLAESCLARVSCAEFGTRFGTRPRHLRSRRRAGASRHWRSSRALSHSGRIWQSRSATAVNDARVAGRVDLSSNRAPLTPVVGGSHRRGRPRATATRANHLVAVFARHAERRSGIGQRDSGHPGRARSRSGVGLVGPGLRPAGAPEADESGDQRDEKELADEHLENRDGLADRSRRTRLP